MTNFIQINGKKIELTDEQVQQITEAGIIKRDNPFEKGKNGAKYYYISSESTLCTGYDYPSIKDDNRFEVANYCDDDKLIKQRALHETLSRLLWRFSMTHGGDEIDWSDADSCKYYIFYNYKNKSFGALGDCFCRCASECYFSDFPTAEQAIKEIVMPFLEQHPEFVW